MIKQEAMSTEAFIRDCAVRGMSKNECRETLGVNPEKFADMLALIGDLPWPVGHKSLARRLSNEERRGHCSPAQAAALASSRARRKAKRSRTLRGVTGTIEELAKHFGCPVTPSTIRRRLANGDPPETAFFAPGATPSRLHAGWY